MREKRAEQTQLGRKAPLLPPESLRESPQNLNFLPLNGENTLLLERYTSPHTTVKGPRHAWFIKILGSLCQPKQFGR